MPKPKSLAQQHAEIEVRAQKALNVFRTAADELVKAAEEHGKVAAQAAAQVEHFLGLRAAAEDAAAAKTKQAEAIQSLVQ